MKGLKKGKKIGVNPNPHSYTKGAQRNADKLARDSEKRIKKWAKGVS